MPTGSPASVAGAGAPPYLATIATVIAAIAALYFGRDMLIPMALAALLAFALEPLATRLRRLGLGRIGSVLVVVVLALTLIGGFGYTIGSQVMKLALNVPAYKVNIERKIHSMRSSGPASSALEKASTALRELGDEIKKEKPSLARPAPREAVPVQVQTPDASPLQVAQEVLGPVLGPAGMAGLVVVFLVFMLLEQEDLRDRLIRLFGGRDLTVTTRAMTEAAHRVSRYLLMQLMVNASYGVPIGLGLWLIGVPNALLWGALAVVLRFIPYIGPFIAMSFPLMLAVAVDPGWSMLWWTLGLFLGVELVSNNLIEPWLYGASTGISAVAIIAAAIFWTTLWGPAGLLLSTPLTVCLVVLGRYVPQLHFLDVLLGSAPALRPSERFYQRMLAGDALEGVEIATQVASGEGMVAFERDVALPALQMAEADRQRKLLSTDRAEAVGSAVLKVLSLVDDPDDDRPNPDPDGRPVDGLVDSRPLIWRADSVVCVGRRTALDTAAAALLAQALQRAGIGARAGPPGALNSDALRDLIVNAAAPVELVVIVHLGDSPEGQARSACKRVRRHGSMGVLLAIFDAAADAAQASATATPTLAAGACDGVVRSFSDALQWIDERARAPLQDTMIAAPLPAGEDERIAALAATGLLDAPMDPAFDAITRSLKEAFDAPIALLSLIDERRQFWFASSGLPEELRHARESPRESSICGHVVAANDVLVVEDTLRDPRFANNPFLRAHGVRFYLGAPLSAHGSQAIGALCVMDFRPRSVSRAEEALVKMAARQVMAEIGRRSAALA